MRQFRIISLSEIVYTYNNFLLDLNGRIHDKQADELPCCNTGNPVVFSEQTFQSSTSKRSDQLIDVAFARFH